MGVERGNIFNDTLVVSQMKTVAIRIQVLVQEGQREEK